MKINELPREDVCRILVTSEQGLSEEEAGRRLAEFGPNAITAARKRPLWLRFLGQLTHFLAVLLRVAAGLSFLSEYLHPGEGMFTLGFAILGVIVINAVFTFIQEYRAKIKFSSYYFINFFYIIKFINIVKSLVAEKGWVDVDISITLHDVEVKKPLCIVCCNNDPYKFEFNEYNQEICLECSAQQTILETGITYRDYNRVNIVGKFVYNRVLHFQDCIKQYQGKQNCKIPDKLYKDLEEKFKSYRLLVENTSVDAVKYSNITKDHIIMFLKELQYTKHYENINMIYHTLTGKQVDNIDYLEHKLVDDFRKLVTLYQLASKRPRGFWPTILRPTAMSDAQLVRQTAWQTATFCFSLNTSA